MGVLHGLVADRTHDPIAPDRSSAALVVTPGERHREPAPFAAQQTDGAVPSTSAPALRADDEAAVRIAVNSASAAELQLLPRIGPVLAQRIIDDRAANGPYRSLSDLQRVRGIGPKTAEQLEALVRFD